MSKRRGAILVEHERGRGVIFGPRQLEKSRVEETFLLADMPGRASEYAPVVYFLDSVGTFE